MDSYDELSNKYLKQNLYITNKIEKWGSKDVKNYPKVITTTRNEIFSSDTEYMSWFWSEESKFKEVKLENFNDRDRLNFLKQYCRISIKKELKLAYENLSPRDQKESVTVAKFVQFWKKLEEEHLFDDQNHAEKLIDSSAI